VYVAVLMPKIMLALLKDVLELFGISTGETQSRCRE